MDRWPLNRSLGLLAGALALGALFFVGARTCRSSRPTPRLIVLLTLDTLRRDAVGAFVGAPADGLSPTPRIDALARRSLRFDDARTPVPLTLPAHTTMLSGRAPVETGVRLNAYGRIPPRETRGYPLLAETLADAGWSTGAFVSAAPLLAARGLDHGFQVYDDGTHALSARGPGEVPERSGPETVGRALAWLRARASEERVFLWVHLFEPHAPYQRSGRYVDDVRAGDEVTGALLDGLEALRGDDVALLLTSDHGEMLGDLGESTHGYLLGDGVLRVPLLLRAPGLVAGVRDDPVELADVAPTLAGLAGLPWPSAQRWSGRDLLSGPVPADRVRVAESLFAHQRYGWAQVVAVRDASGTLVDVGAQRSGWLKSPAPGQPQPAWEPLAEAPGHLAQALAHYKSAERADRIQAGPGGGYARHGRASPLLDPRENGRLLDPYREILRVGLMDQANLALKGLRAQPAPGLLRTWAERVDYWLRTDGDNPEVRFLAGLLEEARATLAAARSAAGEAEVAARLAAAEIRYGEAFAAGRHDPETLLRWAGVRARGREAEMLARLERHAAEVPWDAHLHWLAHCFHAELGQAAEAAAALAAAQRLAETPTERKAVAQSCR